MYDKVTVLKRKNWMEQLRMWWKTGNVGRKENQVMQSGKIKKNSPLLTIGAHTVNHPSLRNLQKQDQYYEIHQSIKELEEIFERKITVFSYPFGSKNDYDEVAIDICKKKRFVRRLLIFRDFGPANVIIIRFHEIL